MHIDISCSPHSTVVVVFMHALFTAGGRSCTCGVVLASSSLRIAAGAATLDQLSTYIHLSTNTTQHKPARNYDHSDLLTDRRAMDVPANLPNPL